MRPLFACLLAFALLAPPALALACGGLHGARVRPPPRPRRVEVALLDAGFAPAAVTVNRRQETILVLTRKTERACARKVVVAAGDERIERDLPFGRPVEVRVRFEKGGRLGYTCARGQAGLVSVR